MSPENEALYIMQDDDEEEWVSPTPASVAIREAVTAATDLDESDISELDSYIDRSTLRQLLEGADDGQRTFTVEGYEVTVDSSGNITVGE